MCICDKIYKRDEEFHFNEEEEDDSYFIRNLYDDNRLSSFCDLCYADIEGERSILYINYCPFCGKQVSFDNSYEEGLLNKKYKIIKMG